MGYTLYFEFLLPNFLLRTLAFFFCNPASDGVMGGYWIMIALGIIGVVETQWVWYGPYGSTTKCEGYEYDEAFWRLLVGIRYHDC